MSEEEAKTEETVAAAAAVAAVADAAADADEAEGGGGGGGEEHHHAKEEESTAQFEPVVQLEAVDVKSGEEDEEVVFSMRAKLFIWGETLLDKGTGNKSWRERGIGDIRILRHKEHQLLRLLMRQEKTMKVICNHAIDPRIELRPNAGNDRSWVWHAFDFASGTLEETMFAIRFADSDIANDFKMAFEKSQADMKELVGNLDEQEAVAAEVTAAADAEAEKAVEETADTLAGLSTKEDAPAAEEAS